MTPKERKRMIRLGARPCELIAKEIMDDYTLCMKCKRDKVPEPNTPTWAVGYKNAREMYLYAFVCDEHIEWTLQYRLSKMLAEL